MSIRCWLGPHVRPAGVDTPLYDCVRCGARHVADPSRPYPTLFDLGMALVFTVVAAFVLAGIYWALHVLGAPSWIRPSITFLQIVGWPFVLLAWFNRYKRGPR